MNTRITIYLSAFFLFLLVLLHPFPASSAPLDNWHVRNSVPGGYTLNAVAYGNGMFVAVGSQGTILSSPDGTNWTPQTSGTITTLNGVAYGSDLFVAVGSEGMLITSPDGITWTAGSSGTSATLMDIVFGNGLFVAVGNVEGLVGTILTSPNGVTWAERYSGSQLQKVTYGDSMYVVLGYGPNFYTSPNGIDWSPQSITGYTNNSFFGIASGNGTLIIVGGLFAIGLPPSPSAEIILTSSDRTNWGETYINGNPDRINGACYGNGNFLAVGSSGKVFASPNGTTWTVNQSVTTESLSSIVFGHQTFVSVGANGTIIQSDPIDRAVGVPTLSTWSMLLFVFLCGVTSIRFLQSRGTSL
ncbi:MAG: cell wall-binding protein [Thermodesulfovibrio sp.]|nr:cell wall-binding protein [Thermodesulfovibrio sp.]